MNPATLYNSIIEELKARERDGVWTLFNDPHPLPTAGAVLLLCTEGYCKNHYIDSIKKVAEEATDAESLRYVALALYRLGLPTKRAEDKLKRLYKDGMWRINMKLPPDPLTTSAILVSLHNTPLLKKERRAAIERIKEENRLPEDIERLIGGQRPIILNLYRALALSLYGKEEAKGIWNSIKTKELVDLPPKVYLDRGIREDRHYPAVLSALLAKTMKENVDRYLEPFKRLNIKREDNARLVTFGFYLGKLLERI